MTGAGLDFLWVELTNRCNLRCVHCYTDSHPGSGDRDLLTTADYESVLRQAYELGCRRMQFIGGEPQLHRDFLRLLATARETGFEFIEVFTNLTQLGADTLGFAAEAGIRFATSVYSDDPAVHDTVTTVRSSHARTVRNLERLVAAGVGTRAAVIRIDQPPEALARTKDFLHGLGVPYVREGDVRGFGRGEQLLDRPAELDGLCGHCWAGKLCVAPDGDAYPCVMARHWPVGNVLASPLAEIVRGAALADIRTTIRRTVWAPRVAAGRVQGPHDGPAEPGSTDSEQPDHGEPDQGEPDQGEPDQGEPDQGEPNREVAAGDEYRPEPASDRGGRGPGCAPGVCAQTCVPDSRASCEPLVEPCEPDEPPAAGPVSGCDVIEFCGPGPCGPELPCPQSTEPTTQPECPQSSEPCPQSPG